MSKICNEAWTGRVKHGKKKQKIGIDSPCCYLVGGFKYVSFSPWSSGLDDPTTGWLNHQPTYCWWFRSGHLGCIKLPVKNGINLPTSTGYIARFLPSTVQLSQPISKSSSREWNTIHCYDLATCEQWDWPSKHGFLWSGRTKVSLLEDLRSSTRNYFCRVFWTWTRMFSGGKNVLTWWER